MANAEVERVIVHTRPMNLTLQELKILLMQMILRLIQIISVSMYMMIRGLRV